MSQDGAPEGDGAGAERGGSGERVGPSASQWIDAFVRLLSERGYVVVGTPVGSGHLATKRVNSFGPFLPCTDYIYVRSVSNSTSSADFWQFHEAARAYSESQFRLPRIMRYHIPNTVSIGVSGNGFLAQMIEFAQRPRTGQSYLGGEKHSAYLVDVVARELYSQGLQVTPGRYGSQNVISSNPNNRTFELMREIHERLRVV